MLALKPPPTMPDGPLPLPAIRRIAADPVRSAGCDAGWHDLKANPLPSLAYGLLFALAGDLIILATLDRPHLLTVSISGFFLIAPAARRRPQRTEPTHGGRARKSCSSTPCAASSAQWRIAGAVRPDPGPRRPDVGTLSAVAFALLGSSSGIDAGVFISSLILSGEHRPSSPPGSSCWRPAGAGRLRHFGDFAVPLMLDPRCRCTDRHLVQPARLRRQHRPAAAVGGPACRPDADSVSPPCFSAWW